MIRVDRLRKEYGSVVAVDGVSFEVPRGEVVGFLGPNGAGKSTTLRILAGFLGATSGRVEVAGTDVAEDPERARKSIGYMPETCPLYPEMRVREYLSFRAELKRVPRRARKDEIDRVATDAHVSDVIDRVVGNLSKGYRQRVGLADALLGSPPLLILDEPTAGLDPNQIQDVRALVRRLGESHTVFLSTHILSEVEAICTRAVVIARGKLLASGTIDEVRALRRAAVVRAVVRAAPERAQAALEGIEGVTGANAKRTGGDLAELVVEVEARADADAVAERVAAALAASGVPLRRIGAEKATLEEVFRELTQRKKEADA